jgi:aspartyl-tRNA(Asn)/glutamyl-tRNA(Gln) amidotransferase subunit B
MMHDESGGGKDSLVDLNRAGTPLLEIVSKPDIASPEEARAYLEEIRLLLREIGVSDCEMQEGSLRCDANVNVHVPLPDSAEGYAATPIVEVKNLNSISGVVRAMKYEAERQYQAYHDRGSEFYHKRMGELPKATAGWDDVRGITRVQRRKEEAADYRYFPEPDLMPVVVDEAMLTQARTEMGELPAQARERLQKDHGLSPYDAGVLTNQGRALLAYFEETARACGDAKAAANWVTNKVLAALKARKEEIGAFPLPPSRLAELIAEQKTTLNKAKAEEVFNRMLETGRSAREAMADLGVTTVTDTALVEIVRRAIAANPKAVADFKKGKAAAANAIKGAIMRETRGTARPEVVQQILLEELQKV